MHSATQRILLLLQVANKFLYAKIASGGEREGIIPQKYQDDALHIALATYNGADAVISWNFKHMVKLKTIRGVNGINKMLGYKELEILTPQSWLQEDDNG